MKCSTLHFNPFLLLKWTNEPNIEMLRNWLFDREMKQRLSFRDTKIILWWVHCWWSSVIYVFMVTLLNFLTTYQVIATQIGTMGTIMYARSASGFCAISLISFIFLDNWNFEQQILREQIVLLKRIPDLMHSFMIYYYCLC